MIIEIPDASDFGNSGRYFLNLAWDAISALYLDIENSSLEEWDDDHQVTDEFWASAQGRLANAAVLAQQGVEFLIKERIAEVSPFLLLYGSPRDWPSRWQEENTPFAAFRTVDAQDLVRIHNTVRADRLDDGFCQRIEALRRLRNMIVHTVDKRVRHSPGELWVSILDASHHLMGPHQWVPVRRSYLQSSPDAVLWGPDDAECQICGEFVRLLKIVKPAEAKLYLGVTLRQRFYICPHCADECSDSDLYPMTAQLRPNSPQSTQIYCFVCRQNHAVLRIPCPAKGCAGNVVQEEGNLCLTCYKEFPRERGKSTTT